MGFLGFFISFDRNTYILNRRRIGQLKRPLKKTFKVKVMTYKEAVERRNLSFTDSPTFGEYYHTLALLKLYDDPLWHRKKQELIIGCSSATLRRLEQKNTPATYHTYNGGSPANKSQRQWSKKTIWYSRGNRKK
jgi:hypothetical protein